MEQTRKRYIEFDVLRACAILLLPLIHLYEELNDCGYLTAAASQSQRWILALCVYAPSVFMLCFGANLFFAKEKTPATYAKRGVHFLFLGVVLNIVRYVIPALIVQITGKADVFAEALQEILCCDIYDFVGAYLLLYAFFKKIKLPNSVMLMITLIMMWANTKWGGASTNIEWLDCFLGRFIYINDRSCFPLLSWAIFPTLGIFIGQLYQNIPEKDRGKLLLKIAIGCLILDEVIYATLVSYGVNYYAVAISPANAYITDITNVFILLLAFGELLPLAYWIVTKFEKSLPVKWLLSLSSVIMSFYVIQWIVVGWLEYMLVFVFPENSVSAGLFYAIFAGVMILTLVLTKLFGEKLQKVLV